LFGAQSKFERFFYGFRSRKKYGFISHKMLSL
jgi:hypothetical protein